MRNFAWWRVLYLFARTDATPASRFPRTARPRDNKQYHVRQSSVKVQTDWEVIEQFDMKNLSKLSAPKPKSTEDLLWCGHLDEIDEKYDKVSVRVPRALERVTDRQFFYVTTTDDEVRCRP